MTPEQIDAAMDPISRALLAAVLVLALIVAACQVGQYVGRHAIDTTEPQRIEETRP